MPQSEFNYDQSYSFNVSKCVSEAEIQAFNKILAESISAGDSLDEFRARLQSAPVAMAQSQH